MSSHPLKIDYKGEPGGARRTLIASGVRGRSPDREIENHMILLEIPDEERTVKNPADQDILDAVRQVEWGALRDGCVDLTCQKSRHTLQIIALSDGLMDVELHETKIDRHWSGVRPIRRSDSLDVALRFAMRDESWRRLVNLRPLDVTARRQAIRPWWLFW